MRQALKKFYKDVEVTSSGIFAYKGNPAAQNSIRVCTKHGIDISKHQSRPFDEKIAEKADVIFVMSVEHLNHIKERFPASLHKTYLFKAFAKKDSNKLEIQDSVPDPIGMEMKYYEKTFDMLNATTKKVLNKINMLIEQKLNV